MWLNTYSFLLIKVCKVHTNVYQNPAILNYKNNPPSASIRYLLLVNMSLRRTCSLKHVSLQ